jgi:outer membrane protein assembly factor BamB
MDCAEARERMAEAALGDLPGDLAAALAQHVAACASCRSEYEALADTLRLVADADMRPLGPEETKRVLAPARRALAATPRRQRLRRVLARVATAAAMLLGAGVLWMTRDVGPETGDCRCWRFVQGDPGNARRVDVGALRLAAQTLWSQPVHGTPGGYKPLAWQEVVVVSGAAAEIDGRASASSAAWLRKQGGEVRAFEAATGRERWRRAFPSGDLYKGKEFPDRCIVNGRLYLTDGAQCLVLDLATGSDLARLDPPAGARGWSYLTAEGDRLYGAARDGRTLFCLEAAKGRVRWTRALDAPEYVPALAAGRLFVHAEDGAVFALDAATGRDLWRREVPDLLGRSSVHARGKRLFVVTQKDEVLALRTRDGGYLWRQRVPGAYASGLALGDEAVYTQGGAVTLALADGRVLRAPAGPVSGVCAAPTVAGSHVLAPGGPQAGRLSLLNLAGAVAFHLDHVAQRACDGAIVANGRVYLVGDDHLVALAST